MEVSAGLVGYGGRPEKKGLGRRRKKKEEERRKKKKKGERRRKEKNPFRTSCRSADGGGR